MPKSPMRIVWMINGTSGDSPSTASSRARKSAPAFSIPRLCPGQGFARRAPRPLAGQTDAELDFLLRHTQRGPIAELQRLADAVRFARHGVGHEIELLVWIFRRLFLAEVDVVDVPLVPLASSATKGGSSRSRPAIAGGGRKRRRSSPPKCRCPARAHVVERIIRQQRNGPAFRRLHGENGNVRIGRAGRFDQMGLSTGGFIFTRSFVLPNGLTGIVPGFMRQRVENLARLFAHTPTIFAGQIVRGALDPVGDSFDEKFRVVASASLCRRLTQAGAVCVWVAR